VWIRHEGSGRFFADPNTVTIYNRAQRYERFRHSDAGDRCDWFGVADDVAREIAGAFEPARGDSDRPFRFERGPSTAPLYLRQRTLLGKAERGEVDRLMLEEEVFAIVASALALSYYQRPQTLERGLDATRRRRELADAARSELVAAPHVNYSVRDLAGRLDCSPFHLCRVFRAHTGKTLHQYRTEHRLHLALERLEGTVGSQQTLSRVAHDLGFASHAHFVRAARQYFGATPSAVRRALAGGPMHS
jgi:AraC-like DNA-binding protein